MTRSIAGIKNGKTVVQLRYEAADMMKKDKRLVYTFDGTERTSGWVRTQGRRDDLVYHISKWEGQLEQVRQIVFAEPETIEPETVEPETVEPETVEPKAIEAETIESETIEPETVEPETIESENVEPETIEPETVEPKSEPKSETNEPENVDPKTIEAETYAKSEAEKLAIAKKLYYATAKNDELTGLREYQLMLCNSNKFFLPEFAILVSYTRLVIESYSDSKSPEGKAHPATIQKNKVDVMKYLKKFVETETDNFPPVKDRTFLDIYNDFENTTRGAFKDIGQAKYKINQERSHKAEEDVRAIKALPYLEWAINQVENLPESSARWKEVAIAIMLLTGRRQSEVLATGVFTFVDESTVIFEGQLKRHIAELVAPEKIPVLGKAAKQVVEAIAWLEKHEKRTLPTKRSVEALQLAAKKSHDRCSRYIAESMEKLADKCQITNNKSWEVQEGCKVVNKFKGHLNRQIYAQICSALFNDSNDRKKRAFISRILLENRDAALSYDRDVEVVDIAEIKNICGTFSE